MGVIDFATGLALNTAHPEIERMSLLNEYAQHLRARNLAPRTIHLRLTHARALAQIPPPTTTELEQWTNPPRSSYAAETIKSRRASARSFFSWLHATGKRPDDPSAALAAVNVPKTLPRVIPDSDFAKALLATTGATRAAILLARYACLRLNEIATLKTTDRHGDFLLVRGKGGKERIVYLAPDLLHALNELEREQGPGYYFPGRFAGHVHKDALHKIIKRVTGWNPHALRHAGATTAYRRTKDLRAVQMMLGHSSIKTTERYLHINDDALRNVSLATELMAA